MVTKEKKVKYFAQLKEYLQQYKRIIFVCADNVASAQMHEIRRALRGKAVVLMGKNTMTRRCIRDMLEEHPELERLLPLVKGNVGLIFTDEDLGEVREIVLANRKAAPAKAGAISPVDVVVPAGPTGMEPTQTSFLQALDIPSKIVKGRIEITSDVHLIHIGQKVGTSESTLLSKLSIFPFAYGLEPLQIYDEGSIYSPKVLDMSEEDILEKLNEAVATITCLSLGAQFPTIVSVKHSLLNGYKNVLALSIATDYTFKQSEQIKEMLENPEAFAAAAPDAAAEVAEEKAEETVEEEESDDDMGMGLFD